MREDRGYWARATRQRISRRRMLRASGVGIAGLAGAALIGCGAEDEGETPTPGAGGAVATPTATATAAATEVAGQPRPGGIFRTADDAVAPHFSPFHPGVDPSWPNTFRRENGYYDHLWQQNATTDPQRLITLQLAESLEPVDETTFIAKIREAHFHDNPKVGDWNSKIGARRLTTEDIVARYEFLKEPPASSNDLIKNKLTATALDEVTLELRTTEPYALFHEEAVVRGTEVPQEMLDETVLKETPPLGTGPFMFDRYQVGSQERAVRNPNYWYRDRPYLDARQYTILPDNAAQEAAFRANQLDSHGFQDIKEMESVTRDLGGQIFVHDYSVTGQALILNIRRDPFKDERIREAITRAIDRQKLINTVYFGDGTLQSYFGDFQPENFPIGWDAVEPHLGYDPQKAKQLVDAATSDGAYDGRELQLMLPVEAQTWVDTGRLIADMLNDVGLNVRTDAIVRNIYLQRAGPRPDDGAPSDFDITMTVYLDYDHHHSNTGSFWQNAGPEDPEIDALIDEVLRTVDPESRKQLSQDLELTLAKMHSNYVPLLGINSHQGFYSYVKDTDFERSVSGMARWQIERWLDDGRTEA